jgi:PKD repeat protein
MNRHTITVTILAFGAMAVAGGAGAQLTAPENLYVQNRQFSTLFQCSDVEKPSLFPEHRYVAFVGAVPADPPVDGYRYKIYTTAECNTAQFYFEDFPAPDPGRPSYGTFFTSRSDPGPQCYQGRAWTDNPDGTRQYGPWSECCCFQVVACPSSLPQTNVTDVGGAGCGGTTYDLSPMLTWDSVPSGSGYDWQALRVSDGAVAMEGSVDSPGTTSDEIGTLFPGDYAAVVRAFGDGVTQCDAPWSPECGFEVFDVVGDADFTWWPTNPKQGQRVRFADLSSGLPLTWDWAFDDGDTSSLQNPSHTYSATGIYNVGLDVTYDGGFDDITKLLTVQGVVQCGDGACEGDETAWSCPADCALDVGETGRAGGSDNRPTIPAAVGGIPGVDNTFWFTEGTIFNPGEVEVSLVFEYTPLNGTEILSAGPMVLGAQRGLYFANIVDELFDTTGNGALWIDASGPVQFLVRQFNAAADGTFGQSVIGTRERLTLGLGDGQLYLIGLRQDEDFRSNIFIQEVDGFPVEVRLDIYDSTGVRLKRARFEVKGHSSKLRSLASLLGTSTVDSAYATIEVMSGDGRVGATGSVVDRTTGDPTTNDPVHGGQVSAKSNGELHDLVAVVTHTKGSKKSLWRSEVEILNATPLPQTVRVEYKPQFDETGFFGNLAVKTFTVLPGEQKSWKDVLGELFEAPEDTKTQGAFHVFSPDGVIIHTRTYNKREDNATLGQVLPALSEGDMINLGETGTMIGLKHSDTTRTNLGIAEYSDQATEFEVQFWTTTIALRHIGTLTESVPAKSHMQITRVFKKLGLSGAPLDDIVAYVTVKNGGSVYAYGSVVDNGTGDATTYLTATN